MKGLRTKIVSLLAAVMLICVMLPMSALAAENVAKIGETEYATLDEAVAAAQEWDTIELLADCELTKGFNKALTFTGNGKISCNRQLTSNGEGWVCFGLYDSSRELTFDGSGVEFEWVSDGSDKWLMLSLSGKLNVNNGAHVTFRFNSKDSGTRNAIYMNAGSEINVTNGSVFQILGAGTGAKAGQGIQLDKAGTAKVTVTGNSTFLIDGTNRGYVASPVIYVEDSTFSVQNCTSNASNGGVFTAINSQINYVNNLGHGLSTSTATIKNSTMNLKDNGYCGFANTGALSIDGTSILHINGNGWNNLTGQAALRQGGTGTVEPGAVLDVTDNYCVGLYVNKTAGNLTIHDGVDLDVVRNGLLTEKKTRLTTTGGGIWNIGTLYVPADADIYNNHASIAGDDIYNTGTITFGDVASDWSLDGEPDCEHRINGYYDDSEGSRWNAHPGDGEELHTEMFTSYVEGVAVVTDVQALKAAHDGEGEKKTSLPGIKKWISVDGEDKEETSVAKGDAIEFKLVSNVPEDLVNYLEPATPDEPEIMAFAFPDDLNGGVYRLAFHDVMDKGLTIDEESISVTVNGKPVTPTTVTVGTDEDGNTTLYVEIELVSLYEAGFFTEKEFGTAPIILTYSATADGNITAGTYLNKAWVEYEDGETSKDTVKIYTGKITIFKYDQENPEKGLEGAEFELEDEDGNTITLTSGKDGHVSEDGLKAGVYTLIETKAPKGYVKSDKPLEIVVATGSNAVVNIKFANGLIPHTGGNGTGMYTMIGICIIAAAGVFFVISRRRDEQA